MHENPYRICSRSSYQGPRCSTSSSIDSEHQLRIRRQRQRRQLLTIGQWDVRTLLDRGANRPERRTALVAIELAKYNIDIAALCEKRFSEYGSVDDLEYSFFWSGKPEGERRESGVGFAIKKDIVTKLTEMPRPVRDIIMTMRLPLSKDNFATIISVYAPTMPNQMNTRMPSITSWQVCSVASLIQISYY